MTHRPVPERVRWAIEILDVGPADEILEIGPGPGVAVGLVSERLGTGHITAVDRSATAVERTIHRNTDHVESGKAIIQHSDLTDASIDERRFDKIFAINVNLFWVKPDGPQWSIVGSLLRSGGRLYLFYETPAAAKAAQVVDTIEAALRRQGFATSTRSAASAMTCVEAWHQPGR
jgi:protein-L-isoaspartate O-methyltransferase